MSRNIAVDDGIPLVQQVLQAQQQRPEERHDIQEISFVVKNQQESTKYHAQGSVNDGNESSPSSGTVQSGLSQEKLTSQEESSSSNGSSTTTSTSRTTTTRTMKPQAVDWSRIRPASSDLVKPCDFGIPEFPQSTVNAVDPAATSAILLQRHLEAFVSQRNDNGPDNPAPYESPLFLCKTDDHPVLEASASTTAAAETIHPPQTATEDAKVLSFKGDHGSMLATARLVMQALLNQQSSTAFPSVPCTTEAETSAESRSKSPKHRNSSVDKTPQEVAGLLPQSWNETGASIAEGDRQEKKDYQAGLNCSSPESHAKDYEDSQRKRDSKRESSTQRENP